MIGLVAGCWLLGNGPSYFQVTLTKHLSSTKINKLRLQQWRFEMTNHTVSQITGYPCGHGDATGVTGFITCPRAKGHSIHWRHQGLCPTQLHTLNYSMEIYNQLLWNPTNNRSSRSGPRVFHGTITVLSLWRQNSGPRHKAMPIAAHSNALSRTMDLTSKWFGSITI